MKTIEVSKRARSINTLLKHARNENLIVRSPDGSGVHVDPGLAPLTVWQKPRTANQRILIAAPETRRTPTARPSNASNRQPSICIETDFPTYQPTLTPDTQGRLTQLPVPEASTALEVSKFRHGSYPAKALAC